MTHKTIPESKRRAAGVVDSLIRLSVGLEETKDLIEDLQNAFTISQIRSTTARRTEIITTAP